ncbi:MAG: 7-cyano-7-deazaguanine synthase QueC [Gammaproteobacteria bacterium]|jgi:7-cyano-7-deazaguanine synthase
MTKIAVVLLSGGLDSTTTLALAKSQGYICHAISFDYGQRHIAELNAAKNIAKIMGVASHNIFNIAIDQFGGSALTDKTQVIPENKNISAQIPSTYVPARNTIFLSIALGFAETLHADAIFIGASSVDYSGYPDCRPEYFAAFNQLAKLATKEGVEGHPIAIETPLLYLTKAQTLQLGLKLGVDYSLTVSCYQATDEGLACGRCDSCMLRKKGFHDAGIDDMTRYILL